MANVPFLGLFIGCCWVHMMLLCVAEQTPIRLPLHHRYDRPEASWRKVLKGETQNASRLARFQSAVKGSMARASALMNKLGSERGTSRRFLQSQSGDYVEPVVSGGGDYFTEIEVGTPATTQVVILDTGSDLVWIQSEPCVECYEQEGTIYNPGRSSSYEEVSCDSTACQELDYNACSSYYYESSGCIYEVEYGDGSVSIGQLSTDILTLETGRGGEVMFENFVFGCGHENSASFEGAAGILGMGRGDLSLARQLENYILGRFSYCLVPFESTSESILILGYGRAPRRVEFTPMLDGPVGTYYYVEITGISVAGELLAIPRSVFQFSDDGGGVVVDSGTTLTYLPPAAYERVVEAMETHISAAAVESPIEELGLCYNGEETIDYPSLIFHLGDGANMEVPPENYMVQVDEAGTVCLIIANTGMDFTILGNLQQQNFQMFYDLQASLIGFLPTDCTALG